MAAQTETSNFNRYLANHMGVSAAVRRLPNMAADTCK